jgi:hypothetical protein
LRWVEGNTAILGCYIFRFIAILYADNFSALEVAQGEAHKEREREREKIEIEIEIEILHHQ